MTQDRPLRMRSLLLLGSGPLAFGITWLALAGLPSDQRAAGATFAFAVVWWITEAVPLPVTALASTATLVLGGASSEQAAFGAYGDPIVILLLSSFILARAMEVTGLAERLAWYILGRSWASSNHSRLLLAMGGVACGISLIVSNTATTAMLLPIGLGLLNALREKGTRYSIALLLMLTWGSSVAVGLPVGTPPNLIGLSFIQAETGLRIGFLQWAAFAMPITALMLIVAWWILLRRYDIRAARGTIAPDVASDHLRSLGKLSPAELVACAAFGVASVLWMLPDLAALGLGANSPVAMWIGDHVTLAVSAVVGCLVLFLFGRSVESLSWASLAAIEWGTVILFAGGISLGRAMDATGLAANLGSTLAVATGADSLWTITAFGILTAIVLSEIASNTASASILVPVIIGIAQAAGVSPIAPALGVAVGASFGFMMPISTPPNAIVYGSGLVPPREMMKAGILIDLAGFVVTFLALRLLLPPLGLAP